MRIVAPAIEQLHLDRIESLFPGRVELAVLFGSIVTGKTHADSDVDIAVWPGEGTDLDLLAAELMGALETDAVDLTDLRRAGGTLQQVVATRGKLLYQSEPGRFAQFAAVAERRWQDEQRRLPLVWRSIDLFLAERGLA